MVLKTAKAFWCAAFLFVLCAVVPAVADAAAPSAEQAQLLKQFQSSHDRVRARLSPSDRAILDQMCQRLAGALHRAAKLPQDAAAMLRRAMPTLSGGEIGSLADYASGDAGVAGTGGALGSSSAIGSAAGGDSQSQLFQATQQMQETQMSFNLQYLQLQSQMQSENRSYTAVSNIMKTKHDTVKNSISNIR